MEPFKITCVTCRAVLTVRKESMIGQIIACPRCSMMVQITPPAQLSAASALDALKTPTIQAKKAIVAQSAETLAELPDSSATIAPPATTPAPHAEPVLAASFDDAADAIFDPSTAEPVARATAEAATAAAPPVAELPASRWGAYKFPALIVGGAIAGAGLAAAALTLFSPQPEPPTMAADQPASPADKLADSPRTADQVLPTADPSHEPQRKTAAPPPKANPPQVADKTETSPLPAAVVPAASMDESAEPANANAVDETVDEAAVVANHENKETPPAEPREPDAATPRLRIDPLEIDPEGLNLTIIHNGPPKDPLAESQLPADDAPAPSADDAEADSIDAAELPVADHGAVRRDEEPVLAVPADVDALLARRLPGLKVDKMPLCRLLDLAVQISDVPVSVAPAQLRMAAVAAGQPVSAEVSDATLEEFLAAALKPLRLRPVVVDEQIVLLRTSDDRRRSVAYAIDDLASNAEAVQRLAESIERLVAPESWQSAGGAGTMAIEGSTLRIDQLESTHYEILFLLERCRAALGLPLRSKYPAALIAAEPPTVALAERLSGAATFTFSRYTPLREIFRHWQEETDVAVLVDWPALADLRLWPNTRIACSSTDKPWQAAFDTVLEPLGLAWRPIDKRTIEITSLEKASSAPLVEIYQLNPETLATIDNLVGEIEQVAAAAGAPAGDEMASDLIDEHWLLIARQPATVQRAIADYLAGKGLLAGK